MIKYKQIKSDPKNNIWGDCTRCCIAGLLDVPKDRVDDFSPDEDGLIVCHWIISKAFTDL